jgi:hypothetical protein
MPFTYTNRKGDAYTLYRIKTAGGKHRFILAQQSKKGDPADELPTGFRVKETATGAVSIVPDEPSLIQPAEMAAVERALRQLPKPDDYLAVVQHDRIEVYATVAVARYGWYPAPRQGEPPRYAPVLRFVLIDPTRRVFRADRAYTWRRKRWVWLGQIGSISELAETLIPDLADRAKRDPLALDEFDFLAWDSELDDWFSRPRRRVHRSAPPVSVHRLKVTLKHSRPSIWRRLLVPSDMTLDLLHDVLQTAMGWGDEHLHLFEIDGMTFSDPRHSNADIAEEATARLDQAAPYAKSRFRYEYDFGDSWEHEILVEAVQPPEPGKPYLVCLAGERAAPPEDSGGIWRYGWMLESLAGPNDPDRDELLDWLGGPIDPEAFDLEDVNRALAGIR